MDGELRSNCKKNVFMVSSNDLFARWGKFFAYFCPMYNVAILLSVLERLDQWDKWLFIQLNSRFTNPVFDTVLPFFRNSVFWAPLYIFILVFITINYGRKGLW